MPKNRIMRLIGLEPKIVEFISERGPCTTNQITIGIDCTVSFKTVKKYLITLEEQGKIENIYKARFSLWTIRKV